MVPMGSGADSPFELHVLVGGGAEAPIGDLNVTEVAVLQDVSAPAMFALRMSNWYLDDPEVTQKKDPFAVGDQVEIRLGHKGVVASVMVGEVTGLEPEFRAIQEGPMLTVRGHDRRHRLMRGRRTRTFVETKDSEIAKKMAQEAGLQADVEDTGKAPEYLIQYNQTDWEFLEARAWRLGFEIVVDGRTLKFRRRKNEGSEVLTLSLTQDLIEFRPRLSALGLTGEVVVRGWSPKDKKEIAGKASAGSEGTTMGGSQRGLATAKAAFGAAVDYVVDRPVSSSEEAGQIAAGRLREMALAYVTGDGIADGRADLKAGTVIKIAGCGRCFDGLYYLASVCHTWSEDQGYRTAFTVRRNATS